MASGYAPSPSSGPQFNGVAPIPADQPTGKVKAIGLDGLHKMKAAAPNADGMSDVQFALAAHESAYPDVPLADFIKAVGLDRGDVLYETRNQGDVYGDYARKALATAGAGETPDQAAKRQGGSLTTRRAGDGEGITRAALQGATMGFGDELVAAGAAALDPLVNGDRGKDYGQRFKAYLGREQGLVNDYRQDNPVAAYGAEIGGAIPTMLMAPVPGGALGKLGADAALGAVYGAGSTDGGLGERAGGAMTGAGAGVVGGQLGNLIGKGASKVLSNIVGGNATKQVVAAAPMGGAIKAQSKAAFRGAEQTGATIGQKSLGTLQGNVRRLASYEGILLPSGKVTRGYEKAAGAIDMIDEYAKGPMSMKQAQALLKTVRGVANSPGSEGAFGKKLVKETIDHFDAMRPNDFVTSPASQAGTPYGSNAGPQAMKLWQQGMSDWARFKKVDAIEKVVRKAKLNPDRYVETLRSGFRKVLTTERRQQGFSQGELDAMEKFVMGGPLDSFVAFVQRSNPLPAALVGHVFGGLPGAMATGGAKLAVGATAGAVRSGAARRAGAEIRARAAGAVLPARGGPSALPPFTRRLGVAASLPTLDQPRKALTQIIVRGGR